MTFMKELFRRSRTDVDGAVNRKQIFYTTLILLFEASSVYMEHLSPSIYRGTAILFIVLSYAVYTFTIVCT